MNLGDANVNLDFLKTLDILILTGSLNGKHKPCSFTGEEQAKSLHTSDTDYFLFLTFISSLPALCFHKFGQLLLLLLSIDGAATSVLYLTRHLPSAAFVGVTVRAFQNHR